MLDERYESMLIDLKTDVAGMRADLRSVCRALEKLPCENCRSEVTRRVSWKQFTWIVLLLVGVFGSVVGYNYTIDASQWQAVALNSEHRNKSEEWRTNIDKRVDDMEDKIWREDP